MGVVTRELRLEFASSMTSRELLREPFGLLSTASRELLRDEDSWEEFEPLRDAAEEDSDDSNDFFLSAIVKDEDLDAGLPHVVVLLFLGELVSRGGSEISAFLMSSLVNVRLMSLMGVALLFLHALRTFCLLMASTEFFFNILGFISTLELLLLF